MTAQTEQARLKADLETPLESLQKLLATNTNLIALLQNRFSVYQKALAEAGKSLQSAVQQARAELVHQVRKLRDPLIEETDQALNALIDFSAFTRISSLNDLPRYGFKVVALDRVCDCLRGGQSWTFSADPVVQAEEVEQKANGLDQFIEGQKQQKKN